MHLGLEEQVLEVCGRFRKSIENKLERRRQPGGDVATHFRAQHPRRRLESVPRILTFLVGSVHREEDGRVLQVTRHAHVGDGDEPEARILDAHLERLGHDADRVRELLERRQHALNGALGQVAVADAERADLDAWVDR